MISEGIPTVGSVLAAALIAGASLATVLALWLRHAPARQSILTCYAMPSTVLLLDGEALVDATPSGRELVESGPEAGSARFRVLAGLEPLFPGLAARLGELEREGRFNLRSREGSGPSLVLRAEWLGGLTRLTLIGEDHPEAAGGFVDEPLARAELAALRGVLDHAPVPMWRCTATGETVWANGAYLALAATLAGPGHEISWPLPDIFAPDLFNTATSGEAGDPATEGAARTRRNRTADQGTALPRRMLQAGAAQRWYEIASAPAAGDTIHFALPADRLHRAEEALDGTLQTLGQTFAQLPTGLGVFDSGRRLQLFNPAFGALTGIPAESLARRPTLAALLDAMRARATVPEPDDHRLWRRRVAGLEAAATAGHFQEIWTLPSGQTHRVTARPFPDGALAFTIEDISSEMARNRRQRAKSELAHAVVDEIGDALIVFSRDGVVLMINAAARALWGAGLEAAGGRHGGLSAIAHLRSMTAPTLLWDDLSRYVGRFGPREPRETPVRMNDGRLLACRIAPLPQGSSLVQFHPVAAAPSLDEGMAGPDFPARRAIATA